MMKINHDLTACKFCDTLDVCWKIKIDRKEYQILDIFTVCDKCVGFVPYMIDVIDWDDISIERFPETTYNNLPSSDYFAFMRQKVQNKIEEIKEQNKIEEIKEQNKI